MDSNSQEITFSFVSPVYNEQEGLETFYKRLSAVAAKLGEPYEIIFVNDGSTDDTAGVITRLMAADSRVKYVEFSRNFGHQIAVTAGYDFANGRAVISLDSDCQHPPELIPELVARWREGYEVVYTVRKDTHGISAVRRGLGRLVYRAIRWMSGQELTDQADFRLMDRKAVLALRKTREQGRFVRGLVNWIGFRQIGVPYIAEKRLAGSSNYSLQQLIGMATAGMCNFSVKPLRVAPVLGGVFLTVAFLYAIVSLILWPFEISAGSMIHLTMFIVALFGVQFLMMGLIGEYIARIFEETKDRPLYVVRETKGLEAAWKADELLAPAPKSQQDKQRTFVLYT
jgi:dolichol-phosphate mannosyltransferase